jgi:hypothetical protein
VCAQGSPDYKHVPLYTLCLSLYILNQPQLMLHSALRVLDLSVARACAEAVVSD